MALNEEDVKGLLQQFSDLDGEVGDRDEWMNEIFHYAIPHRYNQKYNELNRAQELPTNIFDSAMIQATETFSSGLFSYLTNPASRWLALRTRNKSQMKEFGVSKFFYESTSIVLDVLAESNFYHEIKAFFVDLIVGNAVLYMESDKDEIVRFTCINPMECVWAEGATGKVNVVFRKFKMTVAQLVEKFGDAVSGKVKDAAKNGKWNQQIDVVHCVRPRWRRDITKLDNLNKQFESVYFEKDVKNVLSESGYDKFPYFVARYIKNSGQQYGYGPGNMCVCDEKMLNQLMLCTIRSIQKDTDPVLTVPSDSFILPILQDPGAINFRISGSAEDRIDLLKSGTNYQAVFELIKYVNNKINSAFHVDLFLAITEQTKRMTIPEVNERIAEKFPMLGAMLNRIIDEAISPVIMNVYDAVAQNGLLPQLPDSLRDGSYAIEYVSPLSKSQKVSEVRSLQSTLQFAKALGTFEPSTLDNYDFDAIARESIDIVGGNSIFLREQSDMVQIRAQRAQAQAIAQQKQDLMMASKSVGDASKADLNLAKANQ